MKTSQLLLITLFVSALALSACGGGTTAEPTKVPEPTPVPPTETPEPTALPESTEDPESSQEVVVHIGDNTFDSNTVTISVGTTVVWTHNGQRPHTVTADDGLFDGGNLGNGDTFSYTFEQVGTFPFHCAYHGNIGGQGMSGVVIVSDE